MAVITVGQTGDYQTIHDAVNASAAGDEIDVQGGVTYTDDFFYIGHSLTVKAIGGEAKIVATQPGLFGKAAIVEGVAGADVTIQGFDISGVTVADRNGAAIRHEGGALHLIDDYFHDNQEGLLGNSDDPNATISVEHSEFAFNGDGFGFTHNFYAGNIASVTISDSYFHDAVVGHEIKSRALNTTVTNSRIFDNNTDASYSIDTPNGGNVVISGNTIEQGPNSENNAIFAWGEEGITHPGSLSIDNNVIVNDRVGGYGVLGGPASFTNNQLWNLSDLGNASGSGNVDLAARPSLDTSSLNFISSPSPTPPPPPPAPTPPPPEPTPPPPAPAPEPTPAPPPPAPAPEPEPPPVSPPPPSLTLDQYHTMVATDFLAFAETHPQVWHSQGALKALSTELNSTVVLTAPVPGDHWS